MSIRAYAAAGAGESFQTIDYDLGELGPTEVEVEVDYCGLCHSDLSMWANDWGISSYPFVGGHEVSGRVVAKGEQVRSLELDARVGVGWYAGSCETCEQCLSGNQHLCPTSDQTIVGRHGGFAERVRCDALWATPLPEGLDPAAVGPLFCGGITVFSPIVISNVSPMDRVGVVGIGGLGHMAIQFLNKWGCEVTAFSTSPDKEEVIRNLGAHHFVNSRDSAALDAIASTLDFILVTVNVELNWSKYIAALRPQGKLHLVGAAPSVSSDVSSLLETQKTIGASPLGSPSTTRRMLEFSGRHQIVPHTEILPMSEINEAFRKLHDESPAHRIVLQNDFDA